MEDYSLPYIVLQSLTKKYYDCMIANKTQRAYEISIDIVEMALILQDLANKDKK